MGESQMQPFEMVTKRLLMSDVLIEVPKETKWTTASLRISNASVDDILQLPSSFQRLSQGESPANKHSNLVIFDNATFSVLR